MTIEINLIPHKTRQQRWGRLVLLIGTLLLALILASLVFLYMNKVHERNQTEKTLNMVEEKLKVLQTQETKQTDQALQLQQEVKQLQESSSHSEALLMTFVGLLPKNGTFTHFEYQNGVITLNGEFKGLDEVAGFYHAVQNQKLVRHAELNQVSEISSGGYATDFIIEIDPTAYQLLGGKNN
ncbi:Tfp pilus assembly protein PilN [Pullulanibacillus pueri]|uniref:Tfp pilus assembly protein PilN n=1 Tax=Pullulanibacillus pueri TaxID=1437324 RepID=A0A8J2ZZ45_9BACL|nr:hypothetical protein [Pullulanibacillus pueri]MBM7680504.1 Tfp pilus assembly protein PilN [Pullulanibacillus pueri]GGH86052.1 hypothetical protein GCM10007096_32860 [Pullulanibacillus pueri]